MTKKQKEILENFRNKKILILGCQREGLSTYFFLRKIFPKKKLFIADLKDKKEINQNWKEILENDSNLSGIFGPNHLNKASIFDIIIKSPGIPTKLPKLKEALDNKVLITSNTQIFFDFFEGKIIGITGTKGKSTTASLIYHILKNSNFPAFLAGNIGVPPLTKIEKTSKKNLAVLELSCHQLNELKLSPQIAIIQNITSEHLDYYQTNKEYISAKKQIAKFQNKSDFCIFNDNYLNPTNIANLSPGKKLVFNFDQKENSLCYLQNDYIFYQGEKLIKTTKLKLKGKHNLENVMASIIVAKIFKITNLKIKESLISFSPLPHRLEFVTKHKDISYYNDSLASMPDATIGALQAFKDKNIILIAGGFERQQNFKKLAHEIVKRNLKNLILFKPTGERIAQEIQLIQPNEIKINFVKSMTQAVKKAKNIAQKNDIILLSPASASFGLFKDYKDRGNQFKKEVLKLTENP